MLDLAMQKTTASLSRTRTGCRTCRARKIKCDETKPTCQRCIKSNLDCSYVLHLIWHEESLSKGVCHGRSGVWSKDGRMGRMQEQQQHSSQAQTRPPVTNRSSRRATDKRSNVFLNTTMRDVKLYFEYGNITKDEEQEENAQHTQQFSLSLPVLSNLGALRTLDYDSVLLSHYEAVVCSSRTLLDDATNNPYRHLILPMAMQSEGLYHATLAVSAQILRISDSRFRVAAIDHGHRALKCLITGLQRGKETRSRTEIDEILGLALMLCWFEITDGCRSSWVTHLKGIYSLISEYQDVFLNNSATGAISGVHRFFTRYFSFHLVLARTAFRIEDDIAFSKTASSAHPSTNTEGMMHADETHNSTNGAVPISKLTSFLSLAMPFEDLDQIDAYMGFSNSLLLLINEVADLAWKYHSKESVEAELSPIREQVQQLRHSLETLQQTPPPLLFGASDSKAVSEFKAIAEANRLGALLLLHEVCASRFKRPELFIGAARRVSTTTTMTPESMDSDYDEHLPTTTDDKARYVRGILDPMTENFNSISRTAALPLWPLFIAGCCVTSEEDQITVIKIFEETEKLKRYGNITPAREVIEMIWRQRDLGVQDDRKRRAATMAGNSFPGLNTTCNSQYRATSAGMQLFEWERAMSMMGGLKLSLT